MEQILEMLARMEAKMEANQAEMKADRKAYHEAMMAMLDAHHERMMDCLEKTKENTEKTEPDPGMMQSTEEHQEIPREEAAVLPVGEPRKRRRVCNLSAERRQRGRKGPEEIVSLGGSRPPPAGRCPAVQK
jgi:DNA gyrase/topoisomerase IV subunit A